MYSTWLLALSMEHEAYQAELVSVSISNFFGSFFARFLDLFDSVFFGSVFVFDPIFGYDSDLALTPYLSVELVIALLYGEKPDSPFAMARLQTTFETLASLVLSVWRLQEYQACLEKL